MRARTVLVLTTLLLVLLPVAPAGAAPPAPPSALITISQSTDLELGTPIVLVAYEWQGFRGRVTAHLTVTMNGEQVLTLVGNRYSGRLADLTGAIPAEVSATSNTFEATGYLTAGRRNVPVAGSAVTGGPTQLSLVAVPCE